MGGIHHSPWITRVGWVVALGWSLFQISIASWLILDAVYIRSIHLACALFLAFILPSGISRKALRGQHAASQKYRWQLFLMATAAALSSLYIAMDYKGISLRYGLPLTRDIVAGLILVVFLLEACRRRIGPALPIIAVLFCLYAFLGPYMPKALAFKGVSLHRFIGQMTMSMEGIYGVPLRVSATIVFLFVLFGSMLEQAGAGEFFTRLALSLLGRFKGGPAKAAVLSSGLTGTVSGSSIANIVTTGAFTIPLMKRVGYPPTKAAAIEVAASTDGQIMPPIMGAAAFIMAEYINVPYLQVVKAAAIPALASYVTLFYITHLEASKLGLCAMKKADIPRFRKVLAGGFHYLIPLFVLIYQLMIARKTAEASAFRAVLVMALIIVLQPPIKAWRKGRRVVPAFLKGLRLLGRSLVAAATQGWFCRKNRFYEVPLLLLCTLLFLVPNVCTGWLGMAYKHRYAGYGFGFVIIAVLYLWQWHTGSESRDQDTCCSRAI